LDSIRIEEKSEVILYIRHHAFDIQQTNRFPYIGSTCLILDVFAIIPLSFIFLHEGGGAGNQYGISAAGLSRHPAARRRQRLAPLPQQSFTPHASLEAQSASLEQGRKLEQYSSLKQVGWLLISRPQKQFPLGHARSL
jgi:hypothetical protein